MTTAIRIINTRIALCANSQRPNARISSASFSIELMLDPRSGHDFVLPMARLKNRLDTKLEQNKSLDANPETLASLCRVTSRVPATWDSEVILKCGSLRDDGQCQCTVQVVFHLPKGNKLDRDVLESLMTGAAASCSTVIETWLLQRDHFIVETPDELEIEDHVATLRAEQRARAERRINADERRAKARERYLAELDQINRIVASTIDETRAEFVSEARSSLSEHCNASNPKWSLYNKAIKVIEDTLEEPVAPVPTMIVTKVA